MTWACEHNMNMRLHDSWHQVGSKENFGRWMWKQHGESLESSEEFAKAELSVSLLLSTRRIPWINMPGDAEVLLDGSCCKPSFESGHLWRSFEVDAKHLPQRVLPEPVAAELGRNRKIRKVAIQLPSAHAHAQLSEQRVWVRKGTIGCQIQNGQPWQRHCSIQCGVRWWTLPWIDVPTDHGIADLLRSLANDRLKPNNQTNMKLNMILRTSLQRKLQPMMISAWWSPAWSISNATTRRRRSLRCTSMRAWAPWLKAIVMYIYIYIYI